jgi:hypothetical protein
VTNYDLCSSDNARFMYIEILDTNVVMLVDTVSSVTILKKDVYEKLPLNIRPELRPVNMFDYGYLGHFSFSR